jgi:hypothetical protein
MEAMAPLEGSKARQEGFAIFFENSWCVERFGDI